MKTAREVIAEALDSVIQSEWDTASDYARHADAILQALDAAGWTCVPKEPTEAMIEAGNDALGEWDVLAADDLGIVGLHRAMMEAASPGAARLNDSPMIERRYTIAEIDAMRAAIGSQYEYSVSCSMDGTVISSTYPAEQIERRLRTYLMAGIDPEEIPGYTERRNALKENR